MKSLKTAPQILEHYYPSDWRDRYFQTQAVLRAMRHYARVKREKDINVCLENIKSQLREEVKDEMYEEAYKNFVEQFHKPPY